MKNQLGKKKFLSNIFQKENIKFIIMIAFMALVIISPTFAVMAGRSGIDALDDFASTFLTVFTSVWVQVVCIVSLVIIGIMAVASFQSGGGIQTFKTFVPWAIGVILILSASSITDFFWKKSKPTTGATGIIINVSETSAVV